MKKYGKACSKAIAANIISDLEDLKVGLDREYRQMDLENVYVKTQIKDEIQLLKNKIDNKITEIKGITFYDEGNTPYKNR